MDVREHTFVVLAALRCPLYFFKLNSNSTSNMCPTRQFLIKAALRAGSVVTDICLCSCMCTLVAVRVTLLGVPFPSSPSRFEACETRDSSPGRSGGGVSSLSRRVTLSSRPSCLHLPCATTHPAAHNSVTPVPGDLSPCSDLHTCKHVCACAYKQNAYTQTRNNSSSKNKTDRRSLVW